MTQAESAKRPNRFAAALDWVIAKWGRGLVVLTALATITTVILGVRDLFRLHGPGWAVVLAWFDVILTAVAIAVVFAQQQRHADYVAKLERRHKAELDRYRRNANFALAQPEIHMAFHKLRDAAAIVSAEVDRAKECGQEPQLDTLHDLARPHMIESLQSMTRAFSSIATTSCRMCVKWLDIDDAFPSGADWGSNKKALKVSTLYRSAEALDRSRNGPTDLVENTDFLNVWEASDRCFFGNDLDAFPGGYVNPHRTGDPVTFDYNAAIVWPIQREKRGDNPRGFRILGFLCVDSKDKNVFKRETDFDLGAAYADTLYTVLDSIVSRGA